MDNSKALLNDKDLYNASFAFNNPFQLQMADNQLLTATDVIRIVPKRRMVVFGEWQGKPIVAKLFFDSMHARRHMERELIGINNLKRNNIPTAEILYQGRSAEKCIYILIFERLIHSKSLQTIWSEEICKDNLLPLLKNIMVELATQHVLGVVQLDLHLGNFLIDEKHIYSLDGGQIETIGGLLRKKQSIEHLALFLAQLTPSSKHFKDQLIVHYAKSRGLILKKTDFIELYQLIEKINFSRWRKLAKKIFRNSSAFVKFKSFRMRGMIDRQFLTAEFKQILGNPEILFTHPQAKILKAGRTSTVIKLTVNNQEFVVKRYNIKSPWHFLRRAFRNTRAHHCWKFAQKFNLFGVLTAQPIAFIDHTFLGMKGKSYFVMQYIKGEHAGKCLSSKEAFASKEYIIQSIAELLKNIFQLNMTHGDLKVSNFVIDEKQRPLIIDLDGVREHFFADSLCSAKRRDIQRFLQNFDRQESLQERFKIELEKNIF